MSGRERNRDAEAPDDGVARLDAPNQQVVREDGSGPADEGNGGPIPADAERPGSEPQPEPGPAPAPTVEVNVEGE